MSIIILENTERIGIMRNSIKTSDHRKWKICIDNPFMNCEYIHPLQQKRVAQLIEHLKNDNNINMIIIFGSSVTSRCHTDSDVDIYCDINEKKRVINKYLDFPYDLITNFSVDDILYNEICEKGVIVYEN